VVRTVFHWREKPCGQARASTLSWEGRGTETAVRCVRKAANSTGAPARGRWSLARRLGGAIFRNLAENSSRVSSIPRFRAASINRSNCAGSVLPGRFFRFATTFAIRTTQLRTAAPVAPDDSYHLNTSLRTKMPMSSSSTTTMRMNSIMTQPPYWRVAATVSAARPCARAIGR
jgi:hypothetical protein